MKNQYVLSNKDVIRRSTDSDLREILQWLEQQESDSSVTTFHCNRNITIRNHESGDLLAYEDSDSGRVVAYQWGGLIYPGILEVRSDMRGKGIGRRMAQYCIDSARENGQFVLRIQCEPSSSIKFWESMGFRLDGDPQHHAHQLLTQQFDLPTDTARKNIRFELFKEEKIWRPDIKPDDVVEIIGAYVTNNKIQLSERVFLRSDGKRTHKDSVIAIYIDGENIYQDKGKYLDQELDPDTEILGVRWDNETFVVNSLRLESMSD